MEEEQNGSSLGGEGRVRRIARYDGVGHRRDKLLMADVAIGSSRPWPGPVCGGIYRPWASVWRDGAGLGGPAVGRGGGVGEAARGRCGQEWLGGRRGSHQEAGRHGGVSGGQRKDYTALQL